MAKNDELQKVYQRNVWHSSEGLIISTLSLIIFVLFFSLTEIAAIRVLAKLFGIGVFTPEYNETKVIVS